MHARTCWCAHVGGSWRGGGLADGGCWRAAWMKSQQHTTGGRVGAVQQRDHHKQQRAPLWWRRRWILARGSSLPLPQPPLPFSLPFHTRTHTRRPVDTNSATVSCPRVFRDSTSRLLVVCLALSSTPSLRPSPTPAGASTMTSTLTPSSHARCSASASMPTRTWTRGLRTLRLPAPVLLQTTPMSRAGTRWSCLKTRT
jgi:hypothetical protein